MFLVDLIFDISCRSVVTLDVLPRGLLDAVIDFCGFHPSRYCIRLVNRNLHTWVNQKVVVTCRDFEANLESRWVDSRHVFPGFEAMTVSTVRIPASRNEPETLWKDRWVAWSLDC